MKRFSIPLRASLVYLVLAGTWILASDRLLMWAMDLPTDFSLMQTLKGGSFVLVTSLLLYLFLHRHLHASETTEHKPTPRAWLPLVVFAVTAGALIATGYFTYRSLQTQERTEVQGRLKSVGELKVRQISEWLRQRRGDVTLLTRDSRVASDFQAWLQNPASRPDFLARLAKRSDMLKESYGYSAMVLFDAHGRPRWASDGNLVEEQQGERHDVLRALQTGAMQFVDFHSPEPARGHRVLVGYLGPMTVGEGPDALPVGALFLAADAQDYLFPLVQDWPLPSASGETLLVRRDGDRVRFLNTLRHRPDLPLTRTHSLDDRLLPAARALRGQLGVLGNGVDYRGISVLAYAAAIPGTPWVMIAKEDVAEVYAPLADIAGATALITLLLVLAAAATISLWWRTQIARQQNQLLEQELERQVLVQHFDYLARYANDIILLGNESGHIVEANDRALEAYGYSREEIIGMPMVDLRPPDLRPAFGKMLTALQKTNHLVVETVHRCKDGRTFPAEASIRRIEQDGRLYYQSIVRDITERKRAEAHILRLSRLYNTLSEANQSLVRAADETSLFDMVCRVAVERGAFRLAWVGAAEETGGGIRLIASHGPGRGYLEGMETRLDGSDALSRGPTATALLEGHPHFCNDFQRAPETAPWHALARQHGIAGSAALPLYRRGKAIAVLNLYAGEVGAFDLETQELVKEMAADLSYALDRFADQRALAAERDRAQAYLDTAGVMLVAIDGEGRVTLINRKGLSILGYEAEAQVLGRDWFREFLPVACRPQITEIFQRMIQGDMHDYHETPLLTKAGEERIIAWHNTALQDPGGRVTGILSSGEDVTERKAAERALAHSRALLKSLIDSIPDLISYKDGSSVYLGCNRAFEAYFGRPEAEIVGHTDYDFIDAELARCSREQDDIVLRSGEPQRNEEWVTYPGGRRVLLETVKTPFYGPDSELLGLIGTSRDITARKQAEDRLKHSEESLNRAQAVGHVGSWSLDFASSMLEWSAETYRIVGVAPGEPLRSESLFSRVCAEHRELVQTAWENARKTGQLDLEYRIQVDDHQKWLHVRAEVEFGNDGQARTAVGTVQDITDRKTAEARIRYLAHYDSLTGLANRQLLEDRLDYAISIMARRQRAPLAMLFLDLDRFKNINDSLGHRIGDLLLCDVSHRLRACVREQDTVARTGGDEFMVVLPDTGAKGAARVAEKIMAALSQLFQIEGYALSVGSSIGISMYPENGENFDSLFRSADTAMYRAKQRRDTGYQFFTEAMHLDALRRLQLENGIRHALEAGGDGFGLHYQPQVEVASGRIVGAEALARWRHPQWGDVPPAEFIPVAEECGLILPLGEWILDRAIAQARIWQQAGGLQAVPVAVNLSVVQLRQRDHCDTVERLLAKHGLAPELLELEVTESIAMQEAEHAVDLMSRLHRTGIALSIDDFGTGYSSLNYLKRFHASKLKIDASFVLGLPDDENDAAITTAIIQMGHSLGLKIVAEGVETSAQDAFLREHGCDYLQGYRYGSPAPGNAFSDLIRAGTIAR
jgi:diguanylate cyclase (GGDEF)-like protein/PAS domain S-box-containing protein